MDIVVCFALFLAAMLFCLVKGFSLAWALLFALVLFFALGLRRGYGAKALVKMAWSKMPKSMIVLRILFFIGLLTGLWRSCGTIAFFIYHGIRVITPSLFILVAFLLTVLLSYALGTSFGVASTAGVVLMALARSGGVSEAVTAGVILSGIYFGDRADLVLCEPRRRADGDRPLWQRQADVPDRRAALRALPGCLHRALLPQPHRHGR